MNTYQSFNRLGQEHGTEEGTGIGLMVSKQLAELMGGSIGVKSTVGIGSVFWIEFKQCVQPSMAMLEDVPLELSKTQVPENVRRHTLLYVEDNPANLKLIEQLIARRSDMLLLSATEATRGIEVARTALPEVILMDINLPGISGMQALKILREDSLTMHIPVIALSANALPRDVEKGLEAGFFRYLTKPIRVSELMNTLTDALEFAAEGQRHSPAETAGGPAKVLGVES